MESLRGNLQTQLDALKQHSDRTEQQQVRLSGCSLWQSMAQTWWRPRVKET